MRLPRQKNQPRLRGSQESRGGMVVGRPHGYMANMVAKNALPHCRDGGNPGPYAWEVSAVIWEVPLNKAASWRTHGQGAGREGGCVKGYRIPEASGNPIGRAASLRL